MPSSHWQLPGPMDVLRGTLRQEGQPAAHVGASAFFKKRGALYHEKLTRKPGKIHEILTIEFGFLTMKNEGSTSFDMI